MADRFIDDKMQYFVDDIEKIQVKPNMYISYLGQKGTLHLSKEIINNAVDEIINPNSPAEQIDILLDMAENLITIIDNGRGMPFENIETYCTKIQAGSKMSRVNVGNTAGENGVGMTAVNALSDRFEIISYRYGEKARIYFEKGKNTSPLTVKKISNQEKHGTSVSFQPSTYFLGPDCQFPSEELQEWLEQISYMLPSGSVINFTVNKKGNEAIIQKKFKNKNGFFDYITKMCKKPVVEPIHLINHVKVKEFSKGEELDRFIGLEVAFAYTNDSKEINVDSFCNFIKTIDHGKHVDGVKNGLMRYLIKRTKEILSEKEQKTLELIPNDAFQNLNIVIYISTDLQPHFSGQTKEKLGNDQFFRPLSDLMYRSLDEHFKSNADQLKKLCNLIKTNAKIRLEEDKVRQTVIKNTYDPLEFLGMKKFTPANNTGKNEYRELIIIEGDSAKGSVKSARFDPDTQALFALKGVPMNAFGESISEVFKNVEFQTLTKLIKCNIGEKFDIEKLFYDKIIIMTDADNDGMKISSFICAFFLYHLPKVVEAGKLYKAVAPLYKIKDKDKPFIIDKMQYIEVFEQKIRNVFNIVHPKTNEVYNTAKTKEFLLTNRVYLETLYKFANHFAIHPLLAEFICIHKDSSDFIKKLKARFPELKYEDGNIISGIFEGKYQMIVIDNIFERRLNTLKNLIYVANKGQSYYHIYENYSNQRVDKGIITIAEFLILCQKYQPKIETRFKGLGEINPDDLRETTTNPYQRVLIQLTIDDIKDDLNKLRRLHGKGTKDKEELKELMNHFKIPMEDLDN